MRPLLFLLTCGLVLSNFTMGSSVLAQELPGASRRKDSKLQKLRLRKKNPELSAYLEAIKLYKAFEADSFQGLKAAEKASSMQVLSQSVEHSSREFTAHLQAHSEHLDMWSQRAFKVALKRDLRLIARFALAVKYVDLKTHRTYAPTKAMAGAIHFATTLDKNFYKSKSKQEIERLQFPLIVLFQQDSLRAGASAHVSRTHSRRSPQQRRLSAQNQSAYSQAFALYKTFDRAAERGLKRAEQGGGKIALQNTVRSPSQRFYRHLKPYKKQLNAWSQQAVYDLRAHRRDQRLLRSGFALTLKYADLRMNKGCLRTDCITQAVRYLIQQDPDFQKGLSSAQKERMSYPLMGTLSLHPLNEKGFNP